jgi:hypothetical protein
MVHMFLCDFLHQGNNWYGNMKRGREALTSLTFDTENDAGLMVQSGETCCTYFSGAIKGPALRRNTKLQYRFFCHFIVE